MLDLTIALSLLTIGVLSIVYYILNRPKNVGKNGLPYPPCLPSLPYIGSAAFISKWLNMVSYITDNFEKYGPVVGFYMGNRFAVILNGKDAIFEAFVKKSAVFSNRPLSKIHLAINPKGKGILFHPYNKDYIKYHQLSIRILREFGYHNRMMENRIHSEIEKLVDKITKFKGQAFNPEISIYNCSMNILCGIMFGVGFEEKDPKFKKWIGLLKQSFKQFGQRFPLDIVTFLSNFLNFKNMVNNSSNFKNEIMDLIDERIKICSDPVFSEIHPSFISRYIELEGNDYDKSQLLYFIHDIFNAGTESIAGQIKWSLVLLANNPSIQKLMRDEIHQFVPSNRLPSMDDKPMLTYVEAFILELLRFQSVAPTSIPHLTTNDSELFGFFIPAQTIVVGNIYCANFNPKIWRDPYLFKPERFLNDGQIINKNLLVPFSLGKRSCFGEILAKQEIFLAISSFVQRFEIYPPEGQTKINVKVIYDVTTKPSTFLVRMLDVKAERTIPQNFAH